MHVKKKDLVIITAGKEKGLRGEIIDIDLKHDRVKVERRNMIIKNKKPNQITGEEGARIEKENWIHVSNVLLYSEKLEKGVRTQMRWVGKDSGLYTSLEDAKTSFGNNVPARIQKIRFAPKSGETFGTISAE